MFEVLGILEVARAAIRRVETREIEIATSLTWGFSVAFDLPSLALVTINKPSVLVL